MSAQEHDYELGTLDHEVLERDESIARHQRQRGDERRWMILGAAGTLALMTALVGAVALGGNSEPRHLAASLGSPARDLAAVAAQAVVNRAAELETESASAAAKGTRVARKADAPAPETKKDLVQPSPATAKPDPAAAIPASTSSAAAAPIAKPQVDEPKAEESDDNAFAGLPTLPTVDETDAADAAEPESAAPSDFAHDDNPFVEEDEEDEGDERDDDGEGLAAAPV